MGSQPRAGGSTVVVLHCSPGHLGIVYQALGAHFAGRSTPRTLCFLPDGTILNARSKAKITGGEVGGKGVMRNLRDLGARPLNCGEDPSRWLAEVLPAIGARWARHPGKRIASRQRNDQTIPTSVSDTSTKPKSKVRTEKGDHRETRW